MAGSIKPFQPTSPPAPVMEMARANCAERLRAKGSDAEAEQFEAGNRDDAWAMRHEVAFLMKGVA